MRDAAEIDFQERGPMRGVVNILKGGEPVPDDQRQETQETQLVWSADHDPSTALRQANQLPHESSWILEMLDDLHGRDDVSKGVSQRNAALIEISMNELGAQRKAVVADSIDPHVPVKYLASA